MKSGEGTDATLSQQDRDELERRLGGPFRLDGSFASLWALEEILVPLRRAPNLHWQASWIASYLADVFARAFEEMGLKFERPSATAITVTAPISYRFDTKHDLARLLRPHGSSRDFGSIREVPKSSASSSRVRRSACFTHGRWASPSSAPPKRST